MKREEEKQKFNQMIQKAVDEYGVQDLKGAVKRVHNQLKNSKSLRDNLRAYFEWFVISYFVNTESRTRRGKAWQGESTEPVLEKGVSGESLQKDKTSKLKAGKKNVQETLLDGFNLNKSQKVLGDATVEDLQKEIDMFYQNAYGNELYGRFLKQIHSKLAEYDIVRNKFSDEELRDIQRNTESGMKEKWQ